MLLKHLLHEISPCPIEEPYAEWDIEALSCDSRKISKNSLFVALKGSSYDGASFIQEAVQKGSRAIVSSLDPKSLKLNDNVYFLQVEDPRRVLRNLTQRFYGDPSQNVKTIGITGTNGKTTVTYLIESIFKQAGKDCGVIGTINYRLKEKVIPSGNTTPGFLENQQWLSLMKEEGINYCIMEVSSHALDQGRVDGINFEVGLFTNLTSDHLDYHHTRENYFLAKSKLFSNLSSEAKAVINTDDPYGQRLVSMTEAKIFTYGIKNRAYVMAKDIQESIQITQFKIVCPEGEVLIRTPLIGAHNIYNMLAAAAAALSQGLSLEVIRKGLEGVLNVPGRLEKVNCGQNYTIFLDYAHTQDALENVLSTIKKVTDAKVILVFGCGGNRDKTKRPAMGKVASQLADQVIITNDNPRGEDPQSIINQIVEGFEGDHYTVISDREEAIHKALEMAKSGEIVLLAGKGHETYQIFQEGTIKFDERQIVRSYLYERQSLNAVDTQSH